MRLYLSTVKYRIYQRIIRTALGLLLVALLPHAQAQESEPFDQWLLALRADAAKQGISAATLDAALGGVTLVERVIELDRRQPEFTQTFWNYLDQRVTAARIERGRQMLVDHRELLAKIEKNYGIPPRFLVAFWGLETNYGSFLGSFPTIASLVTLAHDRRRDAFFRAQLIDALRIVDEHSVTVGEMNGSWAGAMGHLQFMPSTFRQYAVDATGDGKRDVWGSLEDAFESGANYLNRLGWQRDETWGREVKLPKGFSLDEATQGHSKSLKAWNDLGVRRADGGALPRVEISGRIILPQGHDGPAFVVYRNYDVILNWNRSINYAIAVGHLADRLNGALKISHGRGVDNRPLTRDQMLDMQRQLNALGYDAGTPDGVPGSQTRAAIRDYQRATGISADGHPSIRLLERLATSTP